jgi:hypothetical protein
VTTGIRATSDFCWINMLTPEPGRAREFFGKLLDWTYVEIPGVGHRVQVGGRDVGGVFDLASPQTPPGTPPAIGVMVKVASADATAARVASLGGKATAAFDVMDQGRMAVCFDPNGAEFDVWEPKKSPGTDADSELHGVPSWFETRTTDVARAAAFYSELFGWTAEAAPFPGSKYTTFSLGTRYLAGMVPISPESGDPRPHWATFFTVRDADAAARDAVALGGKVRVPARDVFGIGRFCGLSSPQDVPFYVIRYES